MDKSAFGQVARELSRRCGGVVRFPLRVHETRRKRGSCGWGGLGGNHHDVSSQPDAQTSMVGSKYKTWGVMQGAAGVRQCTLHY